MDALLTTDLPGLALFRRGKVRDTYRLSDDLLLFVTTDRISAFDVVMPNGIPDKGKVLTGLSRFWFDRLRDLVPNHLVSCDVADLPPTLAAQRDMLAGRIMIGRTAERIDIECVARGYLAGSGLGGISAERHGRGIRPPDRADRERATPPPALHARAEERRRARREHHRRAPRGGRRPGPRARPWSARP